MDHRIKQTVSNSNYSKEKLSLIEQIKKQKALLDEYAKQSATEKKDLRLEMAALEDELRKLRDWLAEIEIENESYKVLVDAEKQLRDARGEAELTAVKHVNSDLKEHLKRLKRDIEIGEKNW